MSRFGASVLPPGLIPGLRRNGSKRLSIRRFDPGGPYFRYALISLIIVWFIAFLAVRVLPNEFISRATLVVPGGTQNVNVSLDSIGQTSTSPTSAYNTGSLSPKVIYKEMAQSESVRADAAKALGILSETGTLEPGKMADVVVWNGTPFSVYALADLVFVDGALLYDRAHPAARPRSDFLQ